jgi:hypothetical protein
MCGIIGSMDRDYQKLKTAARRLRKQGFSYGEIKNKLKVSKSYIKPFSKNYKKNNLYYGTIRVEVPKSTNFRHQVFGWLKVILKNISPKAEVVMKKWDKLRAVAKPANLV